jgi:chorismate mutase
MTDNNLTEWRDRIDALDGELLELLQRRAAVALEVGRVKAERRLPVMDSGREQQVLERLAGAASGGPLDGDAVRDIFSAVIRACRSVQSKERT